MSFDKLPGWLAPIAGVVIGGVIGYLVADSGEEEIDPVFACGLGIGIGLVGGVVVWLADLVRRKPPRIEEPRRRKRRREPDEDDY